MAPQTIAVIGGLDADLIMIANRIPDRGESVLANEYLEALGGKGANSAIATYRTCHKRPSKDTNPVIDHAGEDGAIRVKMIGAVGDDRYGEKFVLELTKNGVDSSGIVTVPDTSTSICFVMVEHSTRENRCLFTLGATSSWKTKDFRTPEQLGGGVRPDLVVAQMEIERDVVEAMIATAGEAGIEFCLNAAPATPIGKRYYRHLTHLLVNESEAAIMTGRDRDEVSEETWPVIAREFLNRGVKNVVITLGAKGAFYANAEGDGHCPGFEVHVEDTTGAGDTFTGAYSSDYLRQRAKGVWDIRSAVIRANKAAAMTIRSVGAQDGIPWADGIDGFTAPHKIPVRLRSISTAGIASEAST
ncbi:ribokinase [Coniochaeta sp. 2T2.1]|nr:ribokinase [Coniochaeta sp. 2T2.1]